MDEKDRKPEERNEHTKLNWETPKLYALDKNETGSGDDAAYNESTAYAGVS